MYLSAEFAAIRSVPEPSMSPDPHSLSLEEYRALRATIRERGTARLFVTAITFVSWAALALTFDAVAVVPALGLIPLVVLAAGFEIVFAAHVGVERVGRYLQARYEAETGLPGWEHAAMRLGKHPGIGGGVDPLFSVTFVVAVFLNFVPIALMTSGGGPELGGVSVELGVYGLLHLILVARILGARQFASSQRQRELPLFSKDVESGQ
jgi:hypothetical protein